jgi:SP family facilitated glucose transporter-like MFS transporter 11
LKSSDSQENAQTSLCDAVQLFGHVANELLHVSCVKTLGVKTLGVKTLGVETLGVETLGVETSGVETSGVETLGQHAVHNDELPATVDICAASEERKEA